MRLLANSDSVISTILANGEAGFLDEWIQGIRATSRSGSIQETQLRAQCARFLRAFQDAVENGGMRAPSSSVWHGAQEILGEISQNHALQGFTPTETATLVFSLKEPLFRSLRKKISDPEAFADEIWAVTECIDALGLYTAEQFLKTREDVIRRHQEEMLELSTPVVKLWANILALPIIGTLDSARTQIVMETLLAAIVETNSKIAIIDITGVATVDTVVAQHLLKTVTAARLMGAECIISGIRPQIAQTIVHLGISLLDVVTKATLYDAFALALEKTGQTVVRAE